MTKREKFSIWGREPEYKNACYEFFQKKKKEFGIDKKLSDENFNYLMEMMDKYYTSPHSPHRVQDLWKKHKDKIKFIKIQLGSRYEPTFMFYVQPEIKHSFSAARCICFVSTKVHESASPSEAVSKAMRHAISPYKNEWKKNQGYVPGVDQVQHAHHVDGKEFKTIQLKYVDKLGMSWDEYVNKLYPKWLDEETSLISYTFGEGWRFNYFGRIDEKGTVKYNPFKIMKNWIEFHEKNREYALINPTPHHETTANQIKFNTKIKNEMKDLLK